MRNKMKKLLCVMMAACMTFSLAACSKTESKDPVEPQGTTATEGSETTAAPETTAEQPKEKVEITMAIEATGDIPEEFQKQVDRFNAQSELANVSIITYAGGEAYTTAITGQIAGQVAPDIIWMNGGVTTQEYAKNDVIIPLDDLLGDIIPGFEQGLMDSFRVDGTVYGIPKDYNTTVLFYNKEMLEAQGLAVPTTMDEFLAAVEACTTDDVYGFGCASRINYLYPFIATMGADFVNADGSIDTEKLQSEEHKQALATFKELFDNEQATTPFLAGAGWDGELFGNGQVAMLYAGSWVTSVITDLEKGGVAPLPVQNGDYSMLFVAGWGITKQCENPEAAAEFIRFISSDEELVEGNKTGIIGLPPTTSAMDKLIEEKKDDPFLPVYREIVDGGVPFTLIDEKFIESYNKAFENYIYSNESIDKTIEDMLNW